MNTRFLRLLACVVLLDLIAIPASGSLTLSQGHLPRWVSAAADDASWSAPPANALFPYLIRPIPSLACTPYRSEQSLFVSFEPDAAVPDSAPTPTGSGLISSDFELLALYQQVEAYTRHLQSQQLNPGLTNELLSVLIKFGGRFVSANFTHP